MLFSPQTARTAWRAFDPRRRVRWAAALSAMLVTPLSVWLAAVEWVQWGSSPSLGRWIFPVAALLSFAIPYLAVAAMAERRSASAGSAAVLVAWCYRVAVIGVLCLPVPYVSAALMLPYLVVALPPTGKILALASIAALIAFFYLQSQLIRAGRLLRGSVPASGLSRVRTERLLAIVLPVAYPLVWLATAAYPDLAARVRDADRWRARAAADAAVIARERQSAGIPLEEIAHTNRELLEAYMGMHPTAVRIVADSASLYVAANNGLVALDRSGLRIRWSADALQSATLVSLGSTVLAGDATGDLYAVAVADGHVRWRLRTVPDWHWASPAPYVTVARDGSLYIGALRFNPSRPVPLVHASAGGAVRWRTSLGRGIECPVAIGRGDTVYAIARGIGSPVPDDTLYALDADGTVVWRRALAAASSIGNLAIGTRGDLVVGGSDHVRIFSPRGIEIAQLASAMAVYAAGTDGVMALDSTVLRYVRYDASRLRWTEVWSYAAPRIAADEKFVAPPILTPSGHVVAATSSRVVVLRLVDGRLLGEHAPILNVDERGTLVPRLQGLSPPALAPDGTIYITDDRAVIGLRDTTSS